MGERFSAEMTIGGSLNRCHVEKFLEAVKQQDVSLEWGDAVFNPDSVDELIESMTDNQLVLRDDQASYGEFPTLEEVCRDIGLSYTVHSDAYAEYSAQLKWWTPGMDGPDSCYSTQDQKPVVLLEVIEDDIKILGSIVNELEQPASPRFTPDDAMERVIKLFERVRPRVKNLMSIIPPIPILPPFRVNQFASFFGEQPFFQFENGVTEGDGVGEMYYVSTKIVEETKKPLAKVFKEVTGIEPNNLSVNMDEVFDSEGNFLEV